MTSTTNFFSQEKCPFRARETTYWRFSLSENENSVCPYCHKTFPLTKYESDTQKKIKKFEDKLAKQEEKNKEFMVQVKELKSEKNKIDNDLQERDEEISRLRDHSQKLLLQIRKKRDEKQCENKLESENQDLKKKLSEKDQEASNLRNLNQRLLEKIKSLKEARSENPEIKNEIGKLEHNEELTRLRSHNQDLLTQIKKLKNDKKSLQKKVEKLTNAESKVDKETINETIEIVTSSDVQIQTLEKGTNTNPIENFTTNTSPKISKNEGSKNKIQNTRIPYRHPNHKNRKGQDESKQYSTYKPTNYNLEKERRQNQQLLWKPKMRNSIQTVDHQTIPMKVDLGWTTSQKMQHICSGIRKLYRFVSSSVTVRSTEDFEKTLRARPRVKEKSYALRTKHFLRGRQCNIHNI